MPPSAPQEAITPFETAAFALKRMNSLLTSHLQTIKQSLQITQQNTTFNSHHIKDIISTLDFLAEVWWTEAGELKDIRKRLKLLYQVLHEELQLVGGKLENLEIFAEKNQKMFREEMDKLEAVREMWVVKIGVGLEPAVKGDESMKKEAKVLEWESKILSLKGATALENFRDGFRCMVKAFPNLADREGEFLDLFIG